jgi:O-antigen ligase
VVFCAAIGQEYVLYEIDQLLLPGALTGRGQIWPVLIQFSSQNLMLGSGYGSFWNIGDASPVLQLTSGWVSQITTGHNGYLDLLVQIGVPGLVLSVFAIVILPLWTLTTQRGIPVRLGGTLIALLTFCIGQNMTESSLFNRDVAVWVAMAVTLAAIRQAAPLRQAESARVAQPW